MGLFFFAMLLFAAMGWAFMSQIAILGWAHGGDHVACVALNRYHEGIVEAILFPALSLGSLIAAATAAATYVRRVR